MSYSQVLKQAIGEKKISYKEISEECEKLGVSIVSSYISKLVNSEMSPPSEQKTKALAKVLGIDEKELIIESYLDKAPQEIIDFLSYARASVLSATTKLLSNNFTKKDFDNLRKAIENMPLSKFLIQTKDLLKFEASNLDGNLSLEYANDRENVNSTFEMKDPVGIEVQDESMFPVIVKGSKITLEIKNEYLNGEMLFIQLISSKDVQIRKCFFFDDKIMLCPLNQDFETITYEKNDIQILGKVRNIIITL